MGMKQTPGRLDMHISLRKPGNYPIALFAVIGFLLSVTQIFGDSPDYSDYSDFFDLVRTEGLDVLVASRFEPGFSILALVLTTLFSANVVVYSWIVAAALLLKGWAIHACSSSQKIFIVVAAFYLIRYFPLHELTQLRAACAIALMLTGSVVLWKGHSLFGISICALALTFHMSSAAIIPALFLTSTRRWQAVFIAFVAFVLISIFSDLITSYLANVIPVFDSYQNVGFGEDRPNPFSIQLLIDWAMIVVSLIMWNRLSLLMKRIVLLELIGMAIFYGGIEFAVIAHRVREFYSVFWVLFVVDGLRQKATGLVTYGFVWVSIIFYFYIFIIAGTFFH